MILRCYWRPFSQLFWEYNTLRCVNHLNVNTNRLLINMPPKKKDQVLCVCTSESSSCLMGEEADVIFCCCNLALGYFKFHNIKSSKMHSVYWCGEEWLFSTQISLTIFFCPFHQHDGSTAHWTFCFCVNCTYWCVWKSLMIIYFWNVQASTKLLCHCRSLWCLFSIYLKLLICNCVIYVLCCWVQINLSGKCIKDRLGSIRCKRSQQIISILAWCIFLTCIHSRQPQSKQFSFHVKTKGSI